jgi:fatty-acyl-CoA synthase
LAAWFRQRAKFSAGDPALSFEGETLSYAAMQARIERFAAMLYALGLRHGDRVAWLGFNHPDIVVTLFAAARLGAIFIPLNFRLTGPELAFLINDAKVHTLIVDDAHAPVIASIAAELPCRHIIHTNLTPQPWPVLDKRLPRLRHRRQRPPSRPKTSPASPTPPAPRADRKGRCSAMPISGRII